MRYKFNYAITALDLWQLSMYGIYSSMIGVCNIIFTIAMLLLTAKFWGNVNSFVKILLIFGIGLFPIIQPIAIYARAKRYVAAIPHDLEICFDDSGIYIRTKKQSHILKWNEIKSISKRPNMIVIYTVANRGYILPNKILKEQREDFYRYLISKVDMR
ncbi:MAG TPA: YcxB family protein [Thermoanaerobacterales bacterium]|nr:YcxB family protein [Thermoanaerobacterales bacterium]